MVYYAYDLKYVNNLNNAGFLLRRLTTAQRDAIDVTVSPSVSPR
jgi:hypothetical protein